MEAPFGKSKQEIHLRKESGSGPQINEEEASISAGD
jgi:hypothetical protein